MKALPPLNLPSVGLTLPHTRPAEHWIYFLQGDDGGPIKIGLTFRDPRWRCADAQTGYPFGVLRIVGLIRGHRRDERQLHARFHSLRLIGEWFTAGPELLGFVAALPLPSFDGVS